jgi:hypothetical protein
MSVQAPRSLNVWSYLTGANLWTDTVVPIAVAGQWRDITGCGFDAGVAVGFNGK